MSKLTGSAQEDTLGRRHTLICALDQLLSCSDGKGISAIDLKQGTLERLGEV
jgi:hypothetical protein